MLSAPELISKDSAAGAGAEAAFSFDNQLGVSVILFFVAINKGSATRETAKVPYPMR